MGLESRQAAVGGRVDVVESALQDCIGVPAGWPEVGQTSKMTVMFALVAACVLWAAVSVLAFGYQPRSNIEAGLLNFGRGYLIAILIFLVLAVYGMSSV